MNAKESKGDTLRDISSGKSKQKHLQLDQKQKNVPKKPPPKPPPKRTVPLAPNTTLETVPLGFAQNRYTAQVCLRTRLAAQSLLLLSKESKVPCSVKKAVIFAHFSEEEANNKSFQRRVVRFHDKLVRDPQCSLTPRLQNKQLTKYQILVHQNLVQEAAATTRTPSSLLAGYAEPAKGESHLKVVPARPRMVC